MYSQTYTSIVQNTTCKWTFRDNHWNCWRNRLLPSICNLHDYMVTLDQMWA